MCMYRELSNDCTPSYACCFLGVFFSRNPHATKFYFDLGTGVKHQSIMVHEPAATAPESRDNLVVHGVHRMCAETATVSHGTSHVTTKVTTK